MEKNFNVNVAKSRLSVGYTKNDHQFLDLWQHQDTYKKVNKKFEGNKKFVLLDGPPYANGQAHMGHALNKTFKDLVVKSRWFMGEQVDYRPGWDCHGLPLELAVEKKYGRLEKQLLKKRCKDLALRSLVKQRKVFQRLGVLGNWEAPYLTLSNEMLTSNWATLAELVKKDLLVYKQYPVHYCPACASSLAEAELEQKLMPKDSLYFKMKLEQKHYRNLHALVWTTTPWTLPMNQALAFKKDFDYQLWSNNNEQLVLQNPEAVQDWLDENNFKFMKEFQLDSLGVTSCLSPLSLKKVPLLHADFVEEGKTGFVHVSCSHGPEDFDLGQRNNMFPKTYLNQYGVFEVEEDKPFFSLNKKKQSQVAPLVLDLLKAHNAFVKYDQAQSEQNVCWRHKTGVFYNATWQVFLDLEKEGFNLKEKVKELLAQSSMDDKHKLRLGQMLLSRNQWCLSRQRSWGCSMNLLVNKVTKELDGLSYQYLMLCSENKDDLAQQLLDENPHLEVFTDVLDVWFDSGNVVNEYQGREGQQSKDFVVNLALEGKDQYRGWFQSMLWLSVAKNEVMPYENLFCHGFVLDENRAKFAKSSGTGNVVDLYANLYGADVLHLWVAAQEPGLDAVFSEKKLEEMKTYYSRLRLCLRFLTSNLYDYNHSQHNSNLEKFSQLNSFDLHRYVMKEMFDLEQKFENDFAKYEFKHSLESLYQFCDKTMSNFFFDWTKNPFYLRKKNSEERLQLQTASYELLMGLFDMVKVFAPFVAEEFYQDYFQGNDSVFEKFYFTKEKKDYLGQLTVNEDWKAVQQVRKLVQSDLEKLQKSKEVKSRTEVKANLFLKEGFYKTLKNVNQHYRLGELLSVSDASYQLADTSSVSLQNLKMDENYQKCPRCWNYELNTSFHDDLCGHCFTEN